MSTGSNIQLEDYETDLLSGTSRYSYDRGASWRTALNIIGIGALSGGLFFVIDPEAELEFVLIVFSGFVALGMFVFLYMFISSKRVVIVDGDNQLIILQNMVYPKRFVDLFPKREVVIPFHDILSVANHSSKYADGSMVYTKISRFTVSENFKQFDKLDVQLRTIARGTPQVSVKRRYELYMYVGAAVVIAVALIYFALLMMSVI